MANQFPQRITIPAFPARSTLVTAGAHAVLPEITMTQMDNFLTGSDGVVRKVRGAVRWGQKLCVPASNADVGIIWRAEDTYGTFFESFGTTVLDEAYENYWHMRAEFATSASYVRRGRKRLVGESTTSRKAALRMVYRVGQVTTTAAFTTPTIFINDSTNNDTYVFGIGSAGLFYLNNLAVAVPIAGTSAAAHTGWHTLEIRLDMAAKTYSIYLDDALLASGGSLTSPGSDTSLTWFMVATYALVAGTSDMYVDSVMYAVGNSSYAAPFTGMSPKQILDWSFEQDTTSRTAHIVATTGPHVWVDDYMQGTWKYLRQVGTGGTTRVARYRNKLIMFNDSTSAIAWDGHKLLTTLPSPTVAFGTEHTGKLFAAGDPLHPSRVYYTQTNNETGWHTEEAPNPSIAAEAGYFDVPGRFKVMGMLGNFYGNLVIWTDHGVGRLNASFDGSGNYVGEWIPYYGDSDLAGPLAIAQVGNDVWHLTERGLDTIQTTDRYGDLISETPSRPIKDYWFPDGMTGNYLNIPAMAYSQMAYNPNEGRVYVPIALASDAEPSRVLVFDLELKQWVGSFTFGGTAAALVALQSPTRPTMMFGKSTGEVFYFQPASGSTLNYDGTYSTGILRSSLLAGRAVEVLDRPDLPHFSPVEKTWKELVLQVYPTGEHSITVTTEANNAPAVSKPYSTNVYKEPALDNTFVLDDPVTGALGDHEIPGTFRVPLSQRGQWFRFTITADSFNDLALLGWGLDFASGQRARAGE